MKIIDCKVNHLTEPLGYKMDRLVFSYRVSEAAGKFQSAARIRVSLHADMREPVYDSGITENIDSLAHAVDMALAPRCRYYWDVYVRSDAGGEEAHSAVNSFETGKRDEPWQGRFITCTADETRHPIFIRDIALKDRVAAARLYICGLGLYEARINGVKVGNEYLTPYLNNYDQWLQYQTFDVTGLLAGDSRLSVELGNGWYKGRYGFHPEKPSYADDFRLLAELRIRYQDGSKDVIGTDADWLVTCGQTVASDIYDGEMFDATLPPTEPIQATPCDDDMADKLSERLSLPVTVHEAIEPLSIIKTPAGETVLDMGQNFSGIFRFRVAAAAGERVRLYFGEILQEGNFYRDNLRSAKAEYTYISDGTECVLEPKFTFYGYRYVKVEGVPDLRKEDFRGLALYSDITPAGSLVTGHALINRLILNTMWGQKSNFLDVPTDCPQRDERMGWTGDAQVFCPTACFLADCHAFFRKYLYDIHSEQQDISGAVPHYIPSFCAQGTPDAGATCSVWGDAACIIPWTLYLYYGDRQILADQYPSMKAWVDYITRLDGDNHAWRDIFHFGDWLALDHPAGGDDQVFGGTDTGFIADVHYANSAKILAQAADVLGEDADSHFYTTLATRIMDDVRSEFYSATGRPCIDTQTGLLLSLRYNIVENREKIQKMLVDKLAESNDKLKTGFVGTPLLCNVLSECGLDDLAYKILLNEDYPGWLHTVKLGATTMWERWNSVNPDGSISSTGMNSLNHYAYGAIVDWLFRHAAGLNPCEDAPGFRAVVLKPMPHRELGFLDAAYESAAGRYELSWRLHDDDRLELNILIPFGCTAKLYLPHAPADVEIAGAAREGEAYVLTAGRYRVEYGMVGK